MKSDPKISPFAPEWLWVMGEDEIKDVDWTHIAKLILGKEKEIIDNYPVSIASDTQKPTDGDTGLGFNSLTSRFQSFNVLKWQDPEIEKIFNHIKEKHDTFIKALGIPKIKVWIKCWANVLRNGEEIKPHLHGVHSKIYLGGHIMVQCNNTSTVYINPINQLNAPVEYSSKNEIGKITLFQNNIPHYTTPHIGDKERISLAFDITISCDNDNSILLDDASIKLPN
jgi:hypothetical protein